MQQCTEFLEAFKRSDQERVEGALEIVGINQYSPVLASIDRSARGGYIWKTVLKNRKFGKRKRTFLMYCAKTGDFARARFLIDIGADVKQEDSEGKTPLSYAIENGHTDLARFLLERGSPVNSIEKVPYLVASYGMTTFQGLFTPLHWAVLKNNLIIARLLIDGGALLSAPFPRQADTPQDGTEINLNKYESETAWIPLFFNLRSPEMGTLLLVHYERCQTSEFDSREFYGRRNLDPLRETFEFSVGPYRYDTKVVVNLFDYDIVNEAYLPNYYGATMVRPIHELLMTANNTETLIWLFQRLFTQSGAPDNALFTVDDDYSNSGRRRRRFNISPLYLLLVESRKILSRHGEAYEEEEEEEGQEGFYHQARLKHLRLRSQFEAHVKIILRFNSEKYAYLYLIYDTIMVLELKKLLKTTKDEELKQLLLVVLDPWISGEGKGSLVQETEIDDVGEGFNDPEEEDEDEEDEDEEDEDEEDD